MKTEFMKTISFQNNSIISDETSNIIVSVVDGPVVLMKTVETILPAANTSETFTSTTTTNNNNNNNNNNNININNNGPPWGVLYIYFMFILIF